MRRLPATLLRYVFALGLTGILIAGVAARASAEARTARHGSKASAPKPTCTQLYRICRRDFIIFRWPEAMPERCKGYRDVCVHTGVFDYPKRPFFGVIRE
jgi:hypothetical protein